MLKIRSASVYGATLPDSLDAITDGLNTKLHTPILSTHLTSTGFVPHPVTNELVTPIAGGYLFALRRDEKQIPSEEIARQTAATIQHAEAQMGRPLSRKERDTLKQDVIVLLAQRAFYKTRVIECLYNIQHQHLLILNAGDNLSDIAVSCLIGALGKLEPRTLHVSDLRHGLTTRLQAFIREGTPDKQAFGTLRPASEVSLKRIESNDEFTAKNVDLEISREVREALTNGCRVSALRLEDDLISVRVTADFKLQSIKWDMKEPEQVDDDEPEDEPADKIHQYRVSAGLKMCSLSGFINSMLEMFQAEPDTTTDGEETDEPANE